VQLSFSKIVYGGLFLVVGKGLKLKVTGMAFGLGRTAR
jgi:hypothetical protein